MRLINDEKPGRGVHALVIGIGAYPHAESYKLGDLSSAPISAAEFALWLAEEMEYPDHPLKSLDVCIAPGGKMDAATRANYLEKLKKHHPDWDYQACHFEELRAAILGWQAACRRHENDVAMFFFVGHGIENKGVLALLAQDFPSAPQPDFGKAIDFYALREATATFLTKDKFFFIDACRSLPSPLHNKRITPNSVLSPDETVSHRGAAPVFFATREGENAWGRENLPSQFTDALLRSFRGAGAERGRSPYQGRWVITPGSLKKGADTILAQLFALNQAKAQEHFVDEMGSVLQPIHVIHAERAPKIPIFIRWPGNPYTLSVTLEGKPALQVTQSPWWGQDAELPLRPSVFPRATFSVSHASGQIAVVEPGEYDFAPPALDLDITIA